MDYLKEHKKQAVCLLAVFLISVILGIFMQTYFSSPKKESSSNLPEAAAAEDKVINFLLVGVDERDDDVGRSDTMLILSFNPAGKRAELISVPRDSRVSIPLHGETKLNHSYAYGGIQLTKQMVEKTVGLHIDNYFVFNFKGFKNAIDAIGGVDLDVEKDMYYRDDWDGEDGLLINLKKGRQHLDAEKSIEYVRYRDGEGDIGRVKRQQAFLKAVSDKLFSAETLPKLPSVLRGIYQNIETDMSFKDCLSLAATLKESSAFEIHSMTVPGKPEMIDDLSYWIIDGKKLKEELEDVNSFLVNGTVVARKEEKKAEKKSDDDGIFHDKEMIDIGAAKWEKVSQKKSDAELEKIKEAEMRERQEEIAYRNRYNYSYDYAPKEDEHQEAPAKPAGKKITVVDASGNSSSAQAFADRLEAQGYDVEVIKSSSVSEKSSAMVSEKDKDVAEGIEASGLGASISYKPSGKNTVVVGRDAK